MLSPSVGAVTIFEAANDSLEELYLGVTSLPVYELTLEHRKHPPAEIAHWKKDHQISYRSIAHSLLPAEAAAFLKSYAKNAGRCGYKIINQEA